MNTRSKLTGALVGALAVSGTVFGLTAVAGADDSESVPETGVAEHVDTIDADAVIIDLDEGDLNEVGDGKVVTEETFEAEVMTGEIPADAVIIDIEDVDEGDWEEYVVD